MLTAAQIMAGELPKTRRVFNVKNIGEIELYRLSIAETRKGQNLCSQAKDLDQEQADALEKHILSSVYYMLHGKYDDVEAERLSDLMDTEQIGHIYNTGLYYVEFSREQAEKNLTASPNSEL